MVDILIGLVIVFIICITPHLLFAIYQWLSSLISDNNEIVYIGWEGAVAQLVNLLLSASHALNIFVFCCQVTFALLLFIFAPSSFHGVQLVLFLQDKMFRALLFCQRVEVEVEAALT